MISARWRSRLGWFGCFFLLPSLVQAQTLSDPSLEVRVLASGLSQPTGMRFLGNDPSNFFAIEKGSGRVQHVVGGMISTALDLSVNSASERGLLGIALHPDFATNGHTYLYYSRSSTGLDTTTQSQWSGNRLSRFTWDGSSLGSETPLLDFNFDAGQSNGPNHNAGPIEFGPDGYLYGTIGDLNRSRAEQNNQSQAAVSSGAGGIYRIADDGSIPASNPFAGHANADFHKWYAYGVRNTFGLAFDPVTGNLWDSENGPNVFDEINLVEAGFNSGWTPLMGPDALDPQGTGDLVALAGSAYSDPEFSWQDPIAVTDLVFLDGSTWGAGYDDALLVGDNNTKDLYLFRLNALRDGFVLTGSLADLVANDAAERDLLLFGQNFGTVTDLQVGPGGAVYITSLTNGTVYQVVPEPSALLLTGVAGLAGLGMALRRRRKGHRGVRGNRN